MALIPRQTSFAGPQGRIRAGAPSGGRGGIAIGAPESFFQKGPNPQGFQPPAGIAVGAPTGVGFPQGGLDPRFQTSPDRKGGPGPDFAALEQQRLLQEQQQLQAQQPRGLDPIQPQGFGNAGRGGLQTAGPMGPESTIFDRQNQIAANQQLLPQFGLSGAESALQGVNIQAPQIGQLGQIPGINVPDAVQLGAAPQIAALQQFGAPGVSQAGTDLTAARQQALGGIGSAIGQGAAGFQQFLGAGQQANQQQAALSGALGPEAQREAFAAFSESPEQAFLREQGQRSVLAGAAATGGLGGGEVQRELTRFGTGLAAQDISNRFNRLGEVAGLGFGAAQGIGQLRGQQAGLESGVIADLGRAQAGFASQANIAGAQLQSAAGLQQQSLGAQRAQQQAALQASTQSQQAGLDAQRQLAIAGFESQRNLSQAGLEADRLNLQASLGSQAALQQAGAEARQQETLASLRFQTGVQGSSNIGNIAQQLAALQESQGRGVSDLTGTAGANIANLLLNAGLTQGQGFSQEGATLANLATGQGTQLQNLALAGGGAIASGVLGAGNIAAQQSSDTAAILGAFLKERQERNP